MVKNNRSFKNVLNKTPLRVSFGGGGTELPRYFRNYGGCVINTTINLFILTKIETNKKNNIEFIIGEKKQTYKRNIKKFAKPKNKNFLFQYTVYKKISQKFLNNKIYPVKISTYSDAPVGSGLGTSSTLTVSLIKAFCGYFSIKLSKIQIALLAFEIERIDLKLEGGLQDHFSASFGGLNSIKINKKGMVKVNKLRVNSKNLFKLKSSMMLIYTGISRDSSKEIKKINKTLDDKNSSYLKYLHFQKQNVFNQINYFNKNNFLNLTKIIDESWALKNKQINKKHKKLKKIIYQIKKNGAYAIKISGAGGGGFLFCLYNPFKFYNIKKIIGKQLRMYILKFSIQKRGSENLFI